MSQKTRKRALHNNSRDRSSLGNLCVLCVSVVSYWCGLVNHRDTENTGVAQSNQIARDSLYNPRNRKSSVVRLIIVAVAFLGLAFFVYAKTALMPKGEYGLASDLPRGASVYAQTSNLPSLIEQWDRSQLKERYLNSTNYQQLQHRHLMLKLISRWEEFNSALGFPLDVATIAGTAENKAALAVYDIGKMDLVFVAPLSDEKIALTNFFMNKDQFEETEASDGSIYYRQQVEADRGRQKQVLAFAALSGRFILATNESLLLRTIANVNHKNANDSLAGDAMFKKLSERVKPHSVTVWVDQTKLNQDYYFKHYWLMENVDELKGIRAGMFDLEQQEGKWIERREFLTMGTSITASTPISTNELRRLYSLVPEDAPFVRIRALQNQSKLPATLLRDTLFDATESESGNAGKSWSWQSYSGEDFYSDDSYDEDWDYDRYSYLDSRYESLIDDPYDARTLQRDEPAGNPLASEVERQFFSDVAGALSPARPSTAVITTRPHMTDGPLFVEFQKAAVIHFQSAGNLRRDLLERAIALAAQGRLTIAGKSAELVWENRREGTLSWRQLQLPLLGWEICYALMGEDLVVANNSELLRTVLDSVSNKRSMEIPAATANDLTIVRLDQRRSAFDNIMNTLDRDDSRKISETFFSGNIASLLDVASEVRRIEISRRSSPNDLHEEIQFVLASSK